jgi:hypothetical protein
LVANNRGTWLHLLPLAVWAIVIATAIPVELRLGRAPSTSPLPLDFLLNVTLYVPFGLALRRRALRGHTLDSSILQGAPPGPWIAVASGALLSAVIEILQIWFVNRQPSVADVLANTMGTAAGIAIGGILARRAALRSAADDGRGADLVISLPYVFIGRRVAAAAAMISLLISTLLVWRVSPSDLSNWDAGYELVLGNEVTGDRPLRGVVSALAVVPDVLSSEDVQRLVTAGDAVTSESLGSHGRWLVDAPVALEGAPLRITGRLGEDFVASIVARNAFTVVLRGSTADTRQDGPARFVSFSRDPYHRNFDVGQEGRRIRFRVRTPATGVNGDIYAETRDVLEAQRPTTIVASYDGDIARIYVAGRLLARRNLSAATCIEYTVCDADLPLAAGVLGVSLALCALPLLGRRREGLVLVVLGTAAVAAVLAYVGGAGSTVPAFHHWFTPTALAGAGALSIAAARGSRALTRR